VIYNFIILNQVNSTVHLVSYPELSYSQVYTDYNESVIIPWDQAIQIKHLMESKIATISPTNPTRS